MLNHLRTRVTHWSTAGRKRAGRLLAPALTAGLLGISHLPAQAQFPINESFTGASTTAFTLGGNAALTGTNTTPGYLRLTAATGNQAGYAVLNSSFASSKGFSISFEFFSYGGSTTAADGISVFLLDANGTDPKVAGQFNIGAYGGSLGYAQKTLTGGSSDINGVSKGYLGIGLDEYGNYATSNEGRVGGYTTTPATGLANTTTLVPQSISLRGAGTGLTGYPFLTSSGPLPFNLSVASTRAQAGTTDYRKAYIYVVPMDGAYQVTVRIQHGTTITTTTDSYKVSTPPANLRIGFGGSTGGFTNVHEIRNLSILNNPYALDDNAITKYGTPIDVAVLSNDTGLGAALAPGTVDLDPTASGIQRTLTVAAGTFTANTQGVVTFTPAAGFSGQLSIPYVVSDVLGQVSNIALITIGVTGADVATSISGPASASPGALVTYTVSTTNNGVETATNVTPTLQLPVGLPVPGSTQYTYNSATGLVTFKPTTLTSRQAVSNSITFNTPASGTSSITATAGYTYPTGAAVPDAVADNNTAALTTSISGLANVATACSTPGKDGPATLTSTSTPNTYYPGLTVSTTDEASVVTVGPAVGSSTAVAAGDLVLVMQMQDASMNTTATSPAYGTISSNTAGQYEYAIVASVSGSPVSSITLVAPLNNAYTTGTNQNFQVVRVPQYSALTVNGVATGLSWNSTTKVGGVLALDVAGVTTFTGTTPGLSMTAKGFAGGGGVNYTGPAPAGTTAADYATAASGAHGSKGEGIAGTPRNFYDGTSVQTTGAGYATGDNNRGAPATGGGGAQDATPATNAGNSGGGGGANCAAGGLGGYGNGSGSSGNRAGGGYAVSGTAARLLLGGGGGAGSSRSATAQASSGGVGGGIIILRTGKTSGTATLQANGGTVTTSGGTQGGGGGGAGGTILLLATPTPTTATSGLASITATATGGAGSNVNNGVLNTGLLAAAYGPGGGGGGGAIYTNGTLSSTTVTGGAAGSTSNGSAGNTTFGATAGTIGNFSPAITAASTNTIGGASSCLPALSVTLSTSTPTVKRTNGVPAPALFTAVISNTGGHAQSTSTTLAMDPLFTYDNTFTPNVSLTTANGTTTTLAPSSYTITGTSSPVFSGPTIPSGATMRILYRTTIATSAVNNTAYQANGNIAFADPTRTAAATTTTPGATFVGGGTVPGSNYAAASSRQEDVTIVAPLPVELVRFDALAVRQSALLSWTTATEQYNDHFTVERSLTGGNFVAIGAVRGQGTSQRSTDYTFTDGEAGHLTASTVYYRLRQVDTDGTVSYSPVRSVRFATAAQAAASLYPNPNQGQLIVDLSTLAPGTYSVQVLDLRGRTLRTQSASAAPLPLDLTDLPLGAYLVRVQGEGLKQTLPLLRN